MHAGLFQGQGQGDGHFPCYWKITVFKLRIDKTGLHPETIYQKKKKKNQKRILLIIEDTHFKRQATLEISKWQIHASCSVDSRHSHSEEWAELSKLFILHFLWFCLVFSVSLAPYN